MSEAAKRIGLPVKPFLYTVDQIATLLDLGEKQVKTYLLHYEGRSVGPCPRDKMIAVNVMPAGEKPEWRVTERALISWMRFKGIRYHERGYVK